MLLVWDTRLCSTPMTAGAGVMGPPLLLLRVPAVVGVPLAAAPAASAAAGDKSLLPAGLPPPPLPLGTDPAGALTVTMCLISDDGAAGFGSGDAPAAPPAAASAAAGCPLPLFSPGFAGCPAIATPMKGMAASAAAPAAMASALPPCSSMLAVNRSPGAAAFFAAAACTFRCHPDAPKQAADSSPVHDACVSG